MPEPATKNDRKKTVQEHLRRHAKRLADTDQAVKTMEDGLKEIAKTVKDIGEINIKQLVEDIERLKAMNVTVERRIARNSAIVVPGLEDEAKDFNLIKAIRAARSNGKVYGDTKEYEIMKEAREKAANVIGVDSEGGWFVPDQVIPDVIGAIYRRSVFLDLTGDGETTVSVVDGLSGAKVRIPKFKSGVIAYWQGEIDESDVSKASVGEVNMVPKKLNALTRMSEEMQRWSGFQFEALLRRDMIEAIARKVDHAIAFGSGTSDEPSGIVTFKDVQKYYAQTGSGTAPSGTVTGGVLDWTGLSNMDLLIEEADLDINSTFRTVSSPAYFRYMSNLRTLNFDNQAENTSPYLAGLPPLTQQRLAELIGPFGKTTMIGSKKTLDGDAKFTDVFRGNFGEILVGRWSGIEVVTDDNYDIVNDTSLIKMRMWMDVGSRYDKAITWCPDARARG